MVGMLLVIVGCLIAHGILLYKNVSCSLRRLLTHFAVHAHTRNTDKQVYLERSLRLLSAANSFADLEDMKGSKHERFEALVIKGNQEHSVVR
jgi:plasmid maintenance system killer protein